jgi:hypothetical protein
MVTATTAERAADSKMTAASHLRGVCARSVGDSWAAPWFRPGPSRPLVKSHGIRASRKIDQDFGRPRLPTHCDVTQSGMVTFNILAILPVYRLREELIEAINNCCVPSLGAREVYLR